MKLTGKEWVSLQTEENGKTCFIFAQITLYHLLNTGIRSFIMGDLKYNNQIKKFTTKFITINDNEISKESKVKVKFKASLNETIPHIRNCKYEAIENDLMVKDLYNCIVDLFEFYAYALNTDIDNINLEITELEVLK